MREVPRYITSIQIQNEQTEQLSVSIGFERNGAIMLCFQDTSEMGQDSNHIDQISFPNSGLMAYGKCSLWLSMFGRYARRSFEDDAG